MCYFGIFPGWEGSLFSHGPDKFWLEKRIFRENGKYEPCFFDILIIWWLIQNNKFKIELLNNERYIYSCIYKLNIYYVII